MMETGRHTRSRRVGKTAMNRIVRKSEGNRFPGIRSLLTPLLILGSLGASGPKAETRDDAPRFSAERVIQDVEAQCAFGPRIPGTEEHRQTRDWIAGQLEQLGRSVEFQTFEANLALTGERATGWNLWSAPVDVSSPGIILLSAHWDTRPLADEEPPGNPTTPFLGANDGAAGVAFVLEMLRALRGTPLESAVAVAFFDAEDSGVRGRPESWCQGSRVAARNPPEWLDRLALGINIDMIAHPGLELRREVYSLRGAPGAMDRLWKVGRELAPGIFLDEIRFPVMDDHVPFIREGYAYLDLIGLPNAHWHRLSDRPEMLDPHSIRTVGDVLLEFLEREKAGLDDPAAPKGKERAAAGKPPSVFGRGPSSVGKGIPPEAMAFLRAE